MGLSFDSEAFIERFQRKLELFRRVAANGVKAEALKLVADGFKDSKDPYGNDWAPLTKRDGNPLIDTGRLRASFHAREGYSDGSTTITIGTNVQYAKYHQFGTVIPAHERTMKRATTGYKKGKFVKSSYKGYGTTEKIAVKGGKIPARMMLPTNGESETWNVAIRETIEESFRRVFGV